MSQLILESAYLSRRVLGAHKLAVSIDPAGAAFEDTRTARILRDPNTCALNEFGDRTICTRMAIFSEEADATLLELEDPSGADRQLWQLLHRPQEGAHTYDIALVVDAHRGRYHLLVTEQLNDPRPDVITVVPLFEAGPEADPQEL